MKKLCILFGIMVLTTDVLFSQSKLESSFLFSSEFEWSNYERQLSKEQKLNIIENLWNQKIKGSAKYMSQQIDDYHILDVNNDGKSDIIYSGFVGEEKEKTILFVYEKGEFITKLEAYGKIIQIIQDAIYLPFTFLILDYPCCENDLFQLNFYKSYMNDMGFLGYTISHKIRFLRDMVFPEKIMDTPVAFQINNSNYNLRSSPEIINDENIVSVYKEGSLGIGLYHQSDSNTNRKWWFVMMYNYQKPIESSLNQLAPESHYSFGWMSDKYLRFHKSTKILK